MLYSNEFPVSIGDNQIIDIKTSSTYSSCKGSTVLLWLDSLSNDMLLPWYNCVTTLLKHNNKVILVMDTNNKSSIRKHICMILAAYGNYNMYEIGSENINGDYINSLVEREASEIEVEAYIGTDVSAFDKAGTIILDIIDRMNDADSLREYLTENNDVIKSIPILFDFLRKIFNAHIQGTDIKIDKLKEEIKDYRKKIDDSDEQYKKALLKTKTQEEQLEKLKVKAGALEKDLSSALDKNKVLEQSLQELRDSADEFGDSIGRLRYQPIDISKIRTFNKYVIYFKEISHVTYARTMTEMLAAYIRMAMKKCLYVIYDNDNDFLAAYRGMNILNGEKLSKNPNIVNEMVENDPVLVTDTNMSVLNALLKTDCDIIVILDRLRCKEDLIVGNLVFKYYIAGSIENLDNMESNNLMKFPADKTFIEGYNGKYLYIPEIPNFNGSMPTAKPGMYGGLVITTTNGGQRPLFDSIVTSCGINLD